MKKYKVTMWNPMVTYVNANNKEEALEKATESDNWEAPWYSGQEKYDVQEITELDEKIKADFDAQDSWKNPCINCLGYNQFKGQYYNIDQCKECTNYDEKYNEETL